jgi:hypothetical protein
MPAHRAPGRRARSEVSRVYVGMRNQKLKTVRDPSRSNIELRMTNRGFADEQSFSNLPV